MSIQVTFTGKVGKKPELKGEGDKQFAVFGVACSKFVGEGKGDERDGQATAYKTTWMDCVCFKGTAKYVTDRFNPGDTVFVRGELEKRTWEKKDRDGNVIDANAVNYRVLVNDIEGPFRPAAKNEDNQAAVAPTTSAPRASAPAPARANNARQTQAPPPPRNTQQQAAADDIPF